MVQEGQWRAFAVQATAGGSDDNAFPLGEAFSAVFRIAESSAWYCKSVKPGAQLSRQRKVIHRCTDDNAIGGKEVVDEFGVAGNGLFDVLVLRLHALESQKFGARKVVNRVGGEIGVDDPGVRLSSRKVFDDRRRELAAYRLFVENAGIDMKQCHGEILRYKMVTRDNNITMP